MSVMDYVFPQPADLAALPPTTAFAPAPRTRNGLVEQYLVRPSGAELNNGTMRRDDEPRYGGARDYNDPAFLSIGPAERRFFEAFARAHGVIASIPFWLRQIGVYHEWIMYDTLTEAGALMLAAVSRLSVEAADAGRRALHAEALARKGASVADGLERQRIWNAQRSEEARHRRECEAQQKAARASARAEIELTMTDTWRPGLHPVIAWVEPSVANALKGARQESLSVIASTLLSVAASGVSK